MSLQSFTAYSRQDVVNETYETVDALTKPALKHEEIMFLSKSESEETE